MLSVLRGFPLFLLIALFSLPASPCICEFLSVRRAKKLSSVVFVGKALEVYGHRAKFKVKTYWKGSVSNEIVVDEETNDCSFDFKVDEEYLVYAYISDESGHLQTNTCSRTRRLSRASEDIKKLGKGKSPQS